MHLRAKSYCTRDCITTQLNRSSKGARCAIIFIMIPQLPFASMLSAISIHFSPGVLTVFFILFFLIWIVFTMIVRYHWSKYGASKLEVFKMNIIFFAGSIAIFGALGIAMLLYYMSAL